MIFHRLPSEEGLEEDNGPQVLRKYPKKSSGEPQVVLPSVILAFAFCLLFVGGALVAHLLGFTEGSRGLIHLTEVVVGAMVGAFFGERAGARAGLS